MLDKLNWTTEWNKERQIERERERKEEKRTTLFYAKFYFCFQTFAGSINQSGIAVISFVLWTFLYGTTTRRHMRINGRQNGHNIAEIQGECVQKSTKPYCAASREYSLQLECNKKKKNKNKHEHTNNETNIHMDGVCISHSSKQMCVIGSLILADFIYFFFFYIRAQSTSYSLLIYILTINVHLLIHFVFNPFL